MNTNRRRALTLITAGTLTGLSAAALRAQGRGRGGPPQRMGPPHQGRSHGVGGPRGSRQDPQMQKDHQLIQMLLQNRNKIVRKVTNLDNGIETVTETNDLQLRKVLVTHVQSMAQRVEQRRPIHQRDPLFAELFRHADKIDMKYRLTDRGIHVVETSRDPYVVKLLQAHAEVVNRFLKYGHLEVRKNHELPPR